MRPTADNIFLHKLDKKVSNLIVPPKYAYRSKEFASGVVVAVGKKITQVFENDEIAYNKDAGTEVEHKGEKFTVIKLKHIMGVV